MNTVILMVVVAMIALLIIQAFQSAQLYDRESTEFSDRMTTTMDRIAIRHEKAEDIRRYMALGNQDFNVQYRDILKEEFRSMLAVEETISIQDTSVFENGEMQDYLIIRGTSYDSISGVTAEQKVMARNMTQLRDLFKKSDENHIGGDNRLSVQLDQRVVQQIFKKARYVNEMMLDVFRSGINGSPAERVDVGFLDSVLKTELAIDRLPSHYEFMITDAKNKPVRFKNAPKHYKTNLDTTKGHSANLFPTNALDEDLYLHISFPKQNSILLKGIGGGLAINFTLMVLIIIALVFMFRTILTQKKLSEIKNDFISNMTHEFKTPISTISLACEAMNDSDVAGTMDEQTLPYVNMISEENKRLSMLVERILQSATLDKGELNIKKELLQLDTLISGVVENAQFRIRNSGGNIQLNLPKEKVLIKGDPMHTANVISNLVDNAIKYSDKAPQISVDLKTKGNMHELIVKDEGIGIKKEHLNKIFDKLYRIPTGNIHNVKGFGLGLSYVKAISDLHGWNVKVRSKYGAGSEFTIEFKA
ncbi:HAMP domain-containing histidine kinase [Crocinitomicaceae bacterium]|nr:HAMP domain-containing histidine kinase [Crocinitomicaceae bacterium]